MQPRVNLPASSLVDTFRAVQVSQTINIAPNWHFSSKTRQQNVGISANYSLLDDLNPQSAFKAQMKTIMGNAFYSVNFPKRKLGFNTSLTYQNVANSLGKIQNFGLNGGIQKSFAKDKFNASANIGYFRNGNAEASGSTFQIGSNMGYRLAKNSSIFVSAQWQKTQTGGVQGKNWSELFGNTGVSMSF
jgi:hypothetical protein